jgi:hypothetical protein
LVVRVCCLVVGLFACVALAFLELVSYDPHCHLQAQPSLRFRDTATQEPIQIYRYTCTKTKQQTHAQTSKLFSSGRYMDDIRCMGRARPSSSSVSCCWDRLCVASAGSPSCMADVLYADSHCIDKHIPYTSQASNQRTHTPTRPPANHDQRTARPHMTQ